VSERRLWWRKILGVAALLILLWLGWGWRLRVRVLAAAEAPVAPALGFVDLQGREFNLRDDLGRVVLINVWASWCGPCRHEIPALARLEAELRGRGLVVLGLNVEELAPEQLASIGSSLGVTYPIVRPVGGLRGSLRPPEVIPHTWIVDRAGRVRVSHSGLATESGLRRACERLLDEPP